jgi:hypothetical protein
MDIPQRRGGDVQPHKWLGSQRLDRDVGQRFRSVRLTERRGTGVSKSAPGCRLRSGACRPVDILIAGIAKSRPH